MKFTYKTYNWIFEFTSHNKFTLYSSYNGHYEPMEQCTYNPIDNTILSTPIEEYYTEGVYTTYLRDYSDDPFCECFKEAYAAYKKELFNRELAEILNEDE